MRRVLVTGGAGFIGSNLIKKIIENGYDVSSLDNYSTGKIENEVPGANYINDDIENILELKTKFDVCFHLAAQSRVQPSFNNPQESIRINVTGTTKVMEWARINNVKVIYAGSSSKHHDPSDSPYAMTKFLGEEVCKLYKKLFNVNVEIARFYNVYGPIQQLDEKFGNVIGIWQVKVKKNQPLPIVGDGNQKRDFIHVHDIVDGLLKISNSKIKHDDAWEIGTGVNYSINDLYKMFNKKYGINSVNIPDQKGNYRETLRVNDDLINLLNWQPKDRLKEYIKNL
tara:strand:+ start:258 stop:1106 length:849 start_codon:yes stop_codon:yes gene_type:complete